MYINCIQVLIMNTCDGKLGTLVTYTYGTLVPTAWQRCDIHSCHNHANSVALHRTITYVDNVVKRRYEYGSSITDSLRSLFVLQCVWREV